MPIDNRKKYLGDGVYFEVVDGMPWIMLSDGFSFYNKIALEPEVFLELARNFAKMGIKLEET